MSNTCTSYCTADSYDVDELAKTLRSEELDPKFYDDVIHIETQIEEGLGHAYIFPYGCVVFWGMESEDVRALLKNIQKHAIKPLEGFVVDECTFCYGEETTIIEEEDVVILEPNDPLMLLSISYGLSQSVKLTVFENYITRAIQKSKDLPAELALKGSISMSRQKLSRKIGALFAERHSINLHNDLLDTPEFFWRRPKYESYYHLSAEYMDINTRTVIMNQRLSILHELYGMLSDELKHLHSSRLEWIVILLIVMEVIMSILHYVAH